MPLQNMQRQLESIYGVPVGHDVEDFLITDAALARELDTSINPREVAEKLLVRQGEDALELSLYLDQDVIDTLRRSDPSERLQAHNRQAYLVALEGVSHFLYVIWNAGLSKSVTQFELEMQAEVDKYVSSLMLHLQYAGVVPRNLVPQLFGNPAFDQSLSESELELYQHANQYAARYCQRLEERFGHDYGGRELLEEVRRFYRLTQVEKISSINALQ